MKTKPFDYDVRRDPKTDHFCIRCQRDIRPGRPFRWVHLVAGGVMILHPDETPDETGPGDCGLHRLGMECVRIVGREWTHKPDAALTE